MKFTLREWQEIVNALTHYIGYLTDDEETYSELAVIVQQIKNKIIENKF